jgi:transposase InsO family protein
MVLVEQFKNCMPENVRVYLNEQKVSNLQDAAVYADEYSLIHKFDKKEHVSLGRKQEIVKSDDVKTNSDKAVKSTSPKSSDVQSDSVLRSRVRCAYCKKPGHLISDCFALKRRDSKKEVALANVSPVVSQASNKDSFPEIFEPFVQAGSVSVGNSDESVLVNILRDTGCAQSLLLDGTLDLPRESFTGDFVPVRGFGGCVNVPLCHVHLNCSLINAPVTLGVVSQLPVDGVKIILGNDLVGEKVTVRPELSDVSSSVCVVTRAQRRELDAEKTTFGVDSQSTSETTFGVDSQSTSETTFGVDSQATSETTFGVDSHSIDVTSCNEFMLKQPGLAAEQRADSEFTSLFESAISEQEARDQACCYFLKGEILMRKWRPPDVSADQEWSVSYQIVVPQKYRQEILRLAHDVPSAGHLGVNKTFAKVARHFYWPGIRKSVSNYVKTCHTCQITGKPNQTIPVAPLKPIPVYSEPFSRVLIDCVGPLPKTKNGNQYLLTIMCTSTRFPEAVPLRNISAKSVLKALVKFFTTFGLPKEVQSDQGSNFMSKIFQQVLFELGIRQVKSSAYHPQSQGAVERFHQTLKSMIKSYCSDTCKEWDDGIPLLLFAAREAVQDSLGFSPFELIFGHTVRGPLKCVKEQWLSEEPPSNLLQYVIDFRTRLFEARSVAIEHLQKAQDDMKSWFDRSCVKRSFKPGDQVLVLLPIPGNPLKAKFHGPYIVETKVSETDYTVLTPDRRKHRQLCHVNLLKPYFVRTVESGEKQKAVAACQNVRTSTDETLDSDLACGVRLNNSDILLDLDSKLNHLDSNQAKQIQDLIFEYPDVFKDTPGRCSLISHDLDVGTADPVKQQPYRLNPLKLKVLEKEIQYMLDNDLIEPSSSSSWSSPCILVPKEGGGMRLCTDFRRVNTLTKSDCFPLPHIDDCVQRVGDSKFVTKVDLLKGYWQVPLTERAKEISAFITPSGLYQYKVMPFGTKNSSATFQRLMNHITRNLAGCEVYIDDVVIYANDWETHVARLRAFLQAVHEVGLTVNLSKTDFAKASVTFLGHIVGQGKVMPRDAKVESIIQFPTPTNKKEVSRFLGMIGFYRKFCKDLATIAAPLNNLLRKRVPFTWCSQCQNSFSAIKDILMSKPVLVPPDYSKRFTLAVDASEIAAGAVLMQENHPVAYFSKSFTTHQKNYSTIEKETCALILSLKHFEVYIAGAVGPTIVQTDHNPLVFIEKMKNNNQRIMRWALMLQSFDIKIEHVKGVSNVVPDALSRVKIGISD